MADLSLDDYIQKKRPDQGFNRGVSKFQNLKVAVNRNGQPKPLMGRQPPNPNRTNFNVTGVRQQFDARQKLAQPQVADARQKLQLKTKFTDARVRIQNKQAQKHASPPNPVGPPKPLLTHKVVVSPQDARKKITLAKLQAKKLDARQLIKNRKQGAGEPSAKSSHPTQVVTGPGRGVVKVTPGVTAAGGSLLRTIKSDTQTDTQRVTFGATGKVARSVGGPFSKTITNPVVKTTTVTRRPNNNIVLTPSSAPPQQTSHTNPQTMRRMPVIHIQNDSYQPPVAARDPPASAPAVSRPLRQQQQQQQQPAPYQHQEPVHYQPQPQQQQAVYQPAPQSQHLYHHPHQPQQQQQPVAYQQQPQLLYQDPPLASQQSYYSSDPQPAPLATHYRDPQPPSHRAHMDMYDTRHTEVAMVTQPYQAPEPDLGGRVAVVRSKPPPVAAVAAPRPFAGSVQSRLSDPVLATDDVISPLQGYKVLITNLHPIVSQADILELFGAVGALKKVRLLKDGVAEVIFVHKEEAVAAVSKYNLRELDGQPMNVKMAIVSTAAPPKPAADTAQPLRTQRVQQPGGQKVDSDNVDLGLLHRALFKTPKEDGPARPVTFTVKI